MESKSKTFTRKLIALFLSVIMALSCFTGAMTAFANSHDDYHDANLASNFMAWAEATDEQTAEALLDYADLYLEDLMTSLMGSSKLYFRVTDSLMIDGYLDSIDGVINIVRQADGLLSGTVRNLLGGDVKNVQVSAFNKLNESTDPADVVSKCNKGYRAVNDAKDIILCVAQLLYENSNDFGGKNVLGQFVKGKFNLGGILKSALKIDSVYAALQAPLNMWDGYENNLVYNIVANLIWENTNWYTDAEVSAFKADISTWNFDVELFGKLSSELLNKINVLVTYPTRVEDIHLHKNCKEPGCAKLGADGKPLKDAEGNTIYYAYGEVIKDKNGKVQYTNDNSALRKYRIEKYMADNNATYEAAAQALGYDPLLKYSTEDKFTNNILLFQYGSKKLSVTKDDTLFSVAFKALEIAWDTVLKGTLGLVHVNYNEGDNKKDDGYIGSSNFDNAYYYWATNNNKWDSANWKNNYTLTKLTAWADAVYEEYGCATSQEFLDGVKKTYNFNRTVVENPKNNWQDINATKLFNQLRYSPIADLVFDMQTGPINLYFEQTGIKEIEDFFDTAFTNYSDMVAGFNDALVAVTKVAFPNSKNIGLGDGQNNVVTSLDVPTMKTTGNTTNATTIANTLVGNVLDMIEYVANTTNENILAPFYKANNITTKADNLTEQNAEEATLPLLITCVNQIKLTDPIHDEKWDACGDFESVGYVALEEVLSFTLPEKDYDQLVELNSNGKYIPALDVDGDGKKTMLEDVLMPMARDAVGYYLNYIVPCRDKAGNRWDVYESDPVTDKTTLFDVLNSVVCYYASTETFPDGKTGKGVAALLGVVDTQGNCLVKMSNTLWENIDNVINSLFPIVGELQYGSIGDKANSKDLIYNNIVTGFLEIGPTNGVTTFIEKLITVVTADPISNKGIDLMVYDNMVAPLINCLFGARYADQGYTNVIPYSEYYDRDKDMNGDGIDSTKSSTPFDSLIQADTIAYYSANKTGNDDGNATGVLGILICNIFEFFGGAGYASKNPAGVNGCWDGAMFAVSAVSSIIPSFIPQLSEHKLKAASAKVENASMSSMTAGTSFSTKLNVTNNSIGLNRFYIDGNSVGQRDRYFIKIKNVTINTNTDQNTISVSGANNVVVAPEETTSFNITGTVPNKTTLYTLNVTYDIFEGKKNGNTLPAQTADNTLYEDQVTKAYLYMSLEKDWRATVYPRSQGEGLGFAADMEPGAGSESTYTVSTPYGGSKAYVGISNKAPLYATFSKDFIIPMSNPSSINELCFRLRNDANTNTRSADGIYTYATAGTSYYPISNGTISSSMSTLSSDNDQMAYAAIDKATGDILNYNRYDFTYDALNGVWDRGTKSADSTTYDKNNFNTKNLYQGYTLDEIKAIQVVDKEDNKTKSVTEMAGYTTRPHVAYTFDDAVAAGVVTGVDRTAAAADKDGNITYVYDSVFIIPSTLLLAGTTVDAGKQAISFGTPTPGIYLTAAKVSQEKSSASYLRWIAYDGTTDLSADAYDMKVALYTSSNNNMKAQIHMIVADDTAASTLNNAYNTDLKEMAKYAPSDFTDADTYNSLQDAFAKALEVVSTPITTTNASTLGSTMITVANTSRTSETYGDPAFKPLADTNALPASIQVNAYKKNGFWYYNKECTMPVYSNSALTDADVVNGKDKAGQAVVKVDGVWYVANSVAYETEWDTTYTYPYNKVSTTPVVVNGVAQYDQIQFVYRDAYGEKVRSTDLKDDGSLKWVYKFAESKSIIKPSTGPSDETRGVYQQAIDNLAYWMEQAKKVISSDFAKDIAEKVSYTRQGMNSVNHNVATYEKMVQIAKAAEGLISSSGPSILDADGEATYEYKTTASAVEIKEAIRLYDFYKSKVIDRNYIGDKIEAEITCATSPQGASYTYNDFTETSEKVTVAVPEEVDKITGEVITPASSYEKDVYTVTGTAGNAAKYGAYSADGTLVNEGETKYTAESWENYVNALGNAIRIAKIGNETPTDSEARNSSTYNAKKELQIAENNLTEYTEEEPPVSDTITITGQIVIATDLAGEKGNVGVEGINIMLGEDIVGTSLEDGTFTAVVPKGTTELTIAGPTTIDRTVTLAGDADIADVVIPIVIADYTGDGLVDMFDKSEFNSAYGKPDAFGIYFDYTGDKVVDMFDKSAFNVFYGNTVNYSAWELA